MSEITAKTSVIEPKTVSIIEKTSGTARKTVGIGVIVVT
jgi:hypothetical protein